MSTEESVKSFPGWGGFHGNQNTAFATLDPKMEFSNKANEYRKIFYHFLGQIKNSDEVVKQYNLLFHTDLNFIPIQIFNSTQLSEAFENELLKLSKNPRQKRKNWSSEESQLLISFVAYFCSISSEEHSKLTDNAWQFLSTIYPGKNQEQLKLKWQSLLKVPLNKIPWSNREDALLLSIVTERGADNWREIALELHSKSGSNLFRQSKQCRERWINHLDPNLKRGSWNDEEDLLLLKELSDKGKKWSEIAKKLPGRTENSVKNRWISLLRKYKLEGNEEVSNEEEKNDREDTFNSEIIKSLIESKEKLAMSSKLGGEGRGGEHKKKKDSASQKKNKSEMLDSNLEGQEMKNKTKGRQASELNGGPGKSELEHKPPITGSEKPLMSQGGAPISGQPGTLLRSDPLQAMQIQALSAYNPQNGNQPEKVKPNDQTPLSNNAMMNQQLKESLQQIVNNPLPQVPNSNISQPMNPNIYQLPPNYSPYNPYPMPQQVSHPSQYNPYGAYPPGLTPPYYQFSGFPNWGMPVNYPYPNFQADQPQFYPQGLPYGAPPNFNQQQLIMPTINNTPNIGFSGVPNSRLDSSSNNLIYKPQDSSVDPTMSNQGLKETFPMNSMIQNPLTPNPMLQNPLTPNPMIQNPLTPNPMIQNPLTPNPIAQDPSIQNSIIQNPMIQNPMIQNPFMQNPMIQNPLMQNPLMQNPLLPNSLMQNPFMQNSMLQNPFTQNPMLQNPYNQFPVSLKPQDQSKEENSESSKKYLPEEANVDRFLKDFQ